MQELRSIFYSIADSPNFCWATLAMHTGNPHCPKRKSDDSYNQQVTSYNQQIPCVPNLAVLIHRAIGPSIFGLVPMMFLKYSFR